MGAIHEPAPVLLVVAVSSRHVEALEWAGERLASSLGPTACVSPPFDFAETDYYAATMGTDLKKQFVAFERLIDPAKLAELKCQTNSLEIEYAALGRHPERRPVNLDPGYITPAKLVLASTKDHAHRIYLREGIYAEITLMYRRRRWEPMEWTYPDYRRDDYQKFFTECREWLLNCGTGGGGLK
jgi:hypothetical protein